MHLILTQGFPPTLGGIEKTMGAIAQALAERGDRVVVMADGGTSVFGAAADDMFGCEVRRFGGFKPVRRRIKAQAAAALVGRGEVQSIICDSWKSLELLPPLGPPVSVLAHGSEFPAGGDPFRARRIRAALAKAQVIAANSRFTADLVRPYLDHPTELRVVMTPIIPPVEADPIALAAYSQGDGLLIAGMARLEPRKGFDRVIEAVAALRPRFPGLRLLIGGDGADRERLRRLAQSVGLDGDAILLGRLTEGEKSALLQAADVFAMPSRREGESVEGYGLVYLEAGWFGAPSLAGREGGAADAVKDGQTGLICDGASTAAVTQALDTLLGDEGLRRRLGKAAQTHARSETWARRVDDFLPLRVKS